ncbi:twin-arginine translocation pathway signal protein [Novosphingobium jiangmenense]|uniref:Twin-arginine translocation pathway signal protein n=1 Tax=Novosphingobium jiangmenense TaxID=2791981 RepID=A0ABS0HCZ7_9SPHN|nr:twin-arginine translocation pathway signal protein [Novosphingobium jiangmenense]MBF9150150.1 twin-arginine translocation pathway signal protein [Novosphingobium jiangmenense]
MKRRLAAACLCLTILAAGPAPVSAQEVVSAAKPLVAPDFRVPVETIGPGFRLVPLGPDLVKIDFEAYMSSIEHLQQTFTRSTAWPHPGITDAEAMVDMETEQARFAHRKSFAYAVLTPDGKRERGCVYVQPSPVPGYGAVVRMWVTKAEYDAGFDAQLQAWVMQWMTKDWPFAKVAYPGRTISWDHWDALVPRKAQ